MTGHIHILRLGHRPQRDARITTHVGLVARALGATSITIHQPDPRILETLQDVGDRFGGPFTAHTTDRWRRWLTQQKTQGATIAHLTMYGLPLADNAPQLRHALQTQDLVLVVGAEKVPGDLYQLADHNIAVGHQPHSEVAALALTLDRITQGRWEQHTFQGKVRIVPDAKGKAIRTAERL